ncbi:hypothetical protein H6P81_001196 [Aristolochia fimbriata]|uniref:Bromo domain-containing protein n=1 Tax=Aristolochia fimbriata TaxID=158543 RepID=A0AAV7F6S4_ARIFI|nr:hypothetical protein H6P81_001196 [Aristolochia fimbriata]
MGKADDVQNDSWGTWEELLLACAVNRHGTRNWDSVAMELQSRAPAPRILTAQNCKHKYRDLQRRFTPGVGKSNDGDDESDHRAIPWLEELRKLRVAELRREVQRYDVSIVSLQLKVKKLTEEREKSLQKKDGGGEKLDLVKDEAGDNKTAEKEKGSLDEKSSPENVPEKRLAGDESDRENRSFSESNSTDPKEKHRETEQEQPDTRPEESLAKPEPAAGTADLTPTDSVGEKPAGEASYNGSSETVAKCPPAATPPEVVRQPDSGESAEFRESVAESNGAKESSDVQSSASLSKKTRRKRKQTGDVSGEEPEADEVSPVSKRIRVKSEPLVGFLEIIRSLKHGSLFERRLESQETEDYQRAIRQHVDLQTVRSRLVEGLYAESTLDFFRDLLLLCNNAIVFFPKNSTEGTAALRLREVVTKELRTRIPSTSPSVPKKQTQQPSASLTAKPRASTPSPTNVPEKPKASAPLTVVGRKRSSIAAKASGESKAVEKVPAEVEEKPDVEPVEADNSSANLNAEPRVTKKRTRERSGTGPRGARTGKGRSNGSNSNSKAATSSPNASSSPNPSSAAKATPPAEDTDKRGGSAVGVAKKRSAANFLNRMKRTSSSNGALLETLKSTGNAAANSKGSEAKKGGKGEQGRRDSNTRAGAAAAAAKQAAQDSPVMKRSVGRPPKKANQQAAASPAPATRGRKEAAAVEAETRPPARKRARR